MKKRFRLSVWQFLAVGYLIVIFMGSVLLILPFATAEGESTSYLNALFTSTSATCVTGLAPYDTGTHWTLFGQIVILLLIQTGGLGFMTFVSIMFIIIGRNMGLENKHLIMASSGGKLSGVSGLVKRIVIGSAIFEVLGAILLSIRFVPDLGWGRGIYFAVFHSVSAFCNAGFDVMGMNGWASLSHYATDPLVTLTIAGLIIMGGLGFCVWGDVIDCRFRFKKYQLNTKVVLIMSLILLLAGTALFLGFEWNNPLYANYNFGERLLVSVFNSVTPRTAGFYVTNPADFSDSGYVVTIMLMFIGGASGSTAGGLKVGTFAVIIMGMIGVFRGNRDINIGKKRIEYSLLSQALAIFAACLMLLMIATLSICAIEGGDADFKSALFECVSALGTVGISLNVPHGAGIINFTATLKPASEVIIIILMYAGRVGILTLAFALAKKRTSTGVRMPVDSLLIG